MPDDYPIPEYTTRDAGGISHVAEFRGHDVSLYVATLCDHWELLDNANRIVDVHPWKQHPASCIPCMARYARRP